MLRACDLLITIAAAWLLLASLESPRRKSRTILASAQTDQSDWHQSNAADQTLASSPSSQSQLKRLDLLMAKLRRNFDSLQANQKKQQNSLPTQEVDKNSTQQTQHQNSYNFYANRTASVNNNNQQRQQQQPRSSPQPNDTQESQFRRPQEVKIDFLRSAQGADRGEGVQQKQQQQLVPHDSRRFKNGNLAKYQRPSSNSSQTLFMLNYQHILPQTLSLIDQKSLTSLHDGNQIHDLTGASSQESLQVAEQQQQQHQQQPQQPPFALFPALQQPQAQQGFSAPQPPLLQDPRIRQMLSNYQRYGSPMGPGSSPLGDYQRQLLTQLNPRPQELHLRPPVQTPGQPEPVPPVAGGQQPFSPFQLLAGPLQALLPGLQAQQQQQGQKPTTGTASGAAAPKTTQSDKTTQQVAPNVNNAVQPQAPFAFLNPFIQMGQQQRQQQQQSPAQRQQGTTGPQGLANLQELYQQLPIYQALMAMRQRQEALQTAQRMRDQQSGQQVGTNSGSLLPGGQLVQQTPQQLPTPEPPLGGLPGAQPPPFAGLGGFALPAGLQQPTPISQQQPPSQIPQSLPIPVTNPINQLPLGQQWPQQQQQPVQQQGNGPVQFDDDQQQQQPPEPKQPIAPVQQPIQPGSAGTQNQNQQDQNDGLNQQNNPSNQSDQSNDSNQEGQDDGNHDNKQQDGQTDDHHSNDQQQQQQQPRRDNDAGQGEQGAGQPEAEDPDLKQFQNFANGGDSFTDLFPPGILSNNDITEIKSEQDKQNKKQEAEERQRQQQQQQQQAPRQQEPNQDQGQEQPDNGNQVDDANNGQSPENQEENQDQDGENGGEDGGQGGEQPDGGSDQPNAAALTSRSADSAASEIQKTRHTSSPGVEYVKST